MDVVIFEVTGQRFALPASCVSEVLDPLPVTPLPYAPSYVDGLVNVAGQVAVQIDAAKRLGVGDSLAAARGNVLVVNIGGNAGSAVHVERVLTKATVEDGEIAQGDVTPEGAANRFFAGEFQWHEAPVLLLGIDAFSLDGMTAEGAPTGNGGLLGTAIGSNGRGGTQAEDEARTSRFSCVIVECNGERYGIPMSEVGEVVDEIGLTVLPHAPVEISGMALLRGTPLLSLSLGVLLGGSGNAPQRKTVVVERNGVRIGLLVEDVAGIEHFADGSVQHVEQGAEIDGYLIGGDGKMIGLLNLDGVISDARFDMYRNYLIRNRMGDAMVQAAETVHAKKRLLTFRLGEEQCAVPLEWIERVEECRDSVSVPGGTSKGLVGAVQIQGEVAPVIDLRREMGVQANDKNATFLVVRMDGGVWALTVSRVERVIEVLEKDIEQVKTSGRDYIGAVGRVNGRLISILTLEPLKTEIANSGEIKKAA